MLNKSMHTYLPYSGVQIRALDPLNCQNDVRYCQLNDFCI